MQFRKKKQQAEAGGSLVPQIQLKQQSRSWKILHNASKKNTKNTRGLKAAISWRLCQLYFTLSTLFQGCRIFEINRVIVMKKRSRQCVIAVNRKKKTFWLVIVLHILYLPKTAAFPPQQLQHGTFFFLGTLEPGCKFIPGGIFLSPAQGGGEGGSYFSIDLGLFWNGATAMKNSDWSNGRSVYLTDWLQAPVASILLFAFVVGASDCLSPYRSTVAVSRDESLPPACWSSMLNHVLIASNTRSKT